MVNHSTVYLVQEKISVRSALQLKYSSTAVFSNHTFSIGTELFCVSYCIRMYSIHNLFATYLKTTSIELLVTGQQVQRGPCLYSQHSWDIRTVKCTA